MESDRTRQLFDMLDEIVELPKEERPAAVDRLAGGDPALRAELHQLLVEEAEAAALFDGGLAPLAAVMVNDEEISEDGRVGRYRVIRPLDSAGTVFEAERIGG